MSSKWERLKNQKKRQKTTVFRIRQKRQQSQRRLAPVILPQTQVRVTLLQQHEIQTHLQIQQHQTTVTIPQILLLLHHLIRQILLHHLEQMHHLEQITVP